MSLGLLPMLHRLPENRQFGMVARITALIFSLMAAWCAVLLVLPPSVGRLLLGDTWPLARHILPWTSLKYVLLVVGTTAMQGLQVRQVGRLLVKVGIGSVAPEWWPHWWPAAPRRSRSRMACPPASGLR